MRPSGVSETFRRQSVQKCLELADPAVDGGEDVRAEAIGAKPLGAAEDGKQMGWATRVCHLATAGGEAARAHPGHQRRKVQIPSRRLHQQLQPALHGPTTPSPARQQQPRAASEAEAIPTRGRKTGRSSKLRGTMTDHHEWM